MSPRNLSDKPLLAMSETELKSAFDLIGLDTNKGILEEARGSVGLGRVEIAAAILSRPEAEPAVATWDSEYGDGEGYRMIGSFIRECRRMKLLRPGESLERRVFVVDLTKCSSKPGKPL